jgi:hypothetical protein
MLSSAKRQSGHGPVLVRQNRFRPVNAFHQPSVDFCGPVRHVCVEQPAGVPGSSQHGQQPAIETDPAALHQASTSQVAMANSMPLVDADPAFRRRLLPDAALYLCAGIGAARPLLLRQRIAPFDEAPHELPGFRRSQILPLLNPLRLVGKIRVLHRFAKPP